MTAFQPYFIPQYRTATLNKVGGLDASETTGIKLTTVPADLDIAVPGICALTYANPIDTSTIEWITYTSIDGTNELQGVTRGAEGWAAKTHLNGCTIGFVFSKSHVNEIMNALTGVTTGVELNVPKITNPKVVTGINDTNGNELLKLTATSSAVNEMTFSNAATGASPVLQTSGNNTDVGLDLKMKGAGKFRKPSVVGVEVLDSATNTATGDGKAFYRVPAELNGMNLTGVNASVYTAGATGTTDIQLRNKTDSVDMLSTKMTIDSGETDTSTAATPAVIDTTKDDVATGDVIAVDIDAIASTAAKGLFIDMRFELP